MARSIQVQCGHCHAQYHVPFSRKGRLARCRHCHRLFYLRPKLSLDDSVLDWLIGEPEEGPPEPPGPPRDGSADDPAPGRPAGSLPRPNSKP
jgi:hypothetical protein